MSDSHQQDLLSSVADLMKSGKYTDMVIRCGGEDLKVHKAVVCPASKILAAQFEREWEESKTSVIHHTEFHPATVKRMVQYIYQRNYDVTTDNDLFTRNEAEKADHKTDNLEEIEPLVSTNDKLTAHLDVYGIAEYYDVAALKLYAKEQFIKVAGVEWQTDGFIEVIRKFHEFVKPSEAGFHALLRKMILTHMNKLKDDPNFVTQFDAAPGLALALLSETMKRHQVEKDEYQDLISRMTRSYEESTAHKEAEIQNLKGEIERERQTALASCANEIIRFNAKCETLDDLVDDVGMLNEQCPNMQCGIWFGKMAVHRKHHPLFGPGQGRCEIRCARCRARL